MPKKTTERSLLLEQAHEYGIKPYTWRKIGKKKKRKYLTTAELAMKIWEYRLNED